MLILSKNWIITETKKFCTKVLLQEMCSSQSKDMMDFPGAPREEQPPLAATREKPEHSNEDPICSHKWINKLKKEKVKTWY